MVSAWHYCYYMHYSSFLARHLSSAPFDKNLLCTCYGTVEDGRGQVRACLGQIGDEEGPVECVATLQQEGNFRWFVIQLL